MSVLTSWPFFSVNLGGWLNTEPFISPALYEPYVSAATPAIDEWTLSVNMAKDTARGGLNQLETHYATFIVRNYSAIDAEVSLTCFLTFRSSVSRRRRTLRTLRARV